MKVYPTRNVLAEVRERKNFYRDYYYKAVGGLRIAVVIIFLLLIAIIVTKLLQDEPLCYANSSDGKVLPLKTSAIPLLIKETK